MKRTFLIAISLASISVSDAQITATQSHDLLFQSGWNMISTYINPVNPLLDSMFFPVVSNVEIIKENSGNVFWPQWGINLIGNHSIGQGYQLKMNMPDTLTVFGTEVFPELTPIYLYSGWNMIAYLRTDPAPIESMLNTLDSNLIIAKNNNGNIYWPQFAINTIGNLFPGQGYLIKTLSSGTFTYPSNNIIPQNFVNIPAGIYPINGINVTLDSYNISKYEVTHEEFILFLNAINCNPDGSYNDSIYGTVYYVYLYSIAHDGNSFYFSGNYWAATTDCPVSNVTWWGAMAYAKWVGGRLPTEAEWEVAGKGAMVALNAGTYFDIYSGTNSTALLGNFSWYNSNSNNQTHSVGTKLSNEIGLYDMTGNVGEWCFDLVQSVFPSDTINPTGGTSGSYRMVRGGTWSFNASECELLLRNDVHPINTNCLIGFRVVIP